MGREIVEDIDQDIVVMGVGLIVTVVQVAVLVAVVVPVTVVATAATVKVVLMEVNSGVRSIKGEAEIKETAIKVKEKEVEKLRN